MFAERPQKSFLICINFFFFPDDYSGKLTPLGQAIALFPVSPRFGKMLALSQQHDLLALTVCLVAALSVQEVLLEVPISSAGSEKEGGTQQKWRQMRRKWSGFGNSKLLGKTGLLPNFFFFVSYCFVWMIFIFSAFALQVTQ